MLVEKVVMADSFFVVCLSEDHYPELIKGKIYKACLDEHGKEVGYMRVWGESKEDFLFPQTWFKEISISNEIEAALAS